MERFLKRHSRQEKKELVKEWQASGLSKAQYCAENDLNKNTFNSWVKKYDLPEAKKFIPVELVEEQVQAQTDYFLIMAGKLEVKMPLNVTDHLISKLIREVSKCI